MVGTARTGSNLVRGMLNSRDDVRAFGELFRSPGEIGFDFPGYMPSRQDRLTITADLVRRLSRSAGEQVRRPFLDVIHNYEIVQKPTSRY